MGGSPGRVIGIARHGQIESAHLEVHSPCKARCSRGIGQPEFLTPAVMIAETECQIGTELQPGTECKVPEQSITESPCSIQQGVARQGVDAVVIVAFRGEVPFLHFIIGRVQDEGRILETLRQRKPEVR